MGFSVANFDIFAMSSFRFSGGNTLSIQAEPWFTTPLRVPWRAPVAPLIISAMLKALCYAAVEKILGLSEIRGRGYRRR